MCPFFFFVRRCPGRLGVLLEPDRATVRRRDRMECVEGVRHILCQCEIIVRWENGFGIRGCKILSSVNTLRTGLLNCLNARSRGLNFRHRASCI